LVRFVIVFVAKVRKGITPCYADFQRITEAK